MFGTSKNQKAGTKILMAFRRNKRKIRGGIGRNTFAGFARRARSMASKFIGGNRNRKTDKYAAYKKSIPLFNIARAQARNFARRLITSF